MRLILRSRKRAVIAASCLAAAVLAVSGCGGGDDDDKAASKPKPPEKTTSIEETSPKTGTAPAATTKQPAKGKSPEDQPGGAGDEQPARVPAELTGRNGKITPRKVRVPPYIAVQITLRSGDGRAYRIQAGSHVLGVNGETRSATAFVPGLRPGKRLLVHGFNGAGNVIIEPNAEPGP